MYMYKCYYDVSLHLNNCALDLFLNPERYDNPKYHLNISWYCKRTSLARGGAIKDISFGHGGGIQPSAGGLSSSLRSLPPAVKWPSMAPLGSGWGGYKTPSCWTRASVTMLYHFK